MSSSDKFKLLGVHTESIDALWDTILPMLIRTLEYSDNKYTTYFIKKCLLNREMQLWVVTKNDIIIAYSITQISLYTTHKRLCFLFLGGSEFLKWARFLPEVLEWSKYMGCSTVELYGRIGWDRLLKRYGFEKIHTVYRLEL